MPKTCFESLKDMEVQYLWYYDTVAILDDYSDSEEGVLPKGELVWISDPDFSETHILLDLKNQKELKKNQFAKGRITESSFLCKATPIQAIVTMGDFGMWFIEVKCT